jgi:hypothetical protein
MKSLFTKHCAHSHGVFIKLRNEFSLIFSGDSAPANDILEYVFN